MRRIERQLISHLKRRGVPGACNKASTREPPFLLPAAPRRSVPTEGIEAWWDVGWAYVMPDFDNPGHSIIEWLSDKPAREPNL